MAEIIWSLRARSWLREIHDYIAEDNPEAAVRTVEGIVDKAQTLSEHPHAGFLLVPELRDDVRVMLYGHYRIVYQVQDDCVYIAGVFHGSLDIRRYLPDIENL